MAETCSRRQSSYSEESMVPIPDLNRSKVAYVCHRRRGSLPHLWIAARNQRCESDDSPRRNLWIPGPERSGEIDDNSSTDGTAARDFRISKDLWKGLLERRLDDSTRPGLRRGRCAAVFLADDSPWPAGALEDTRPRSDVYWAQTGRAVSAGT